MEWSLRHHWSESGQFHSGIGKGEGCQSKGNYMNFKVSKFQEGRRTDRFLLFSARPFPNVKAGDHSASTTCRKRPGG